MNEKSLEECGKPAVDFCKQFNLTCRCFNNSTNRQLSYNLVGNNDKISFITPLSNYTKTPSWIKFSIYHGESNITCNTFQEFAIILMSLK